MPAKKKKQPRMVMLHIPEDKELLAAFGAVAISHGHLDHVLKRVVKTLAGLTPAEADRALAYEPSSSVRRIAAKLAQNNFGKASPVTLKLKAILHECELLTEKRNDLLHSVVARQMDGKAKLLQADHSLRSMPAVKTLNRLAKQIQAVATEINNARMLPGGFIFDAMAKLKEPKARLEQAKAEDD
jgi:ribonuclease BN (tRNA processing enzyme)